MTIYKWSWYFPKDCKWNKTYPTRRIEDRVDALREESTLEHLFNLYDAFKDEGLIILYREENEEN